MGYDPAVIYREVGEALSQKAGRSMQSIANELKVDRHTISRVLRRIAGVSFEQMRTEYMRQALQEIVRRHDPLLKKQISHELGLRSTRVLRAWLAKLGPDSQTASSAPKKR
jgi:predicted ArsR family transcriptional regulator